MHWDVESRPDAFGSWQFSVGAADTTALPLVPLGVSIGVATAIAASAALLIPGDPPVPTSDAVPDEAIRLPLAGSEQALWRRGVQMKHLGWIAGIGGVTAVILAAWAVWQSAGWVGFASGIIGLNTAVLLALGRWWLVIDRRGLMVRSVIGWPRMRIPLNEVVSAEVTTVSPMGDFGGWGYKVDLAGTVGIVVRAGEAIRVRRTGERAMVVTVDDAATGAALLNTLADRGRAH